MTRFAVLNVAFGAPGWWPRGQVRLCTSLNEVGFKGECFFWTEMLPNGSQSHEAAPYAFKPAAFEHVRLAGVDLALWLDASCWATKPLTHVFAWLAEHDVLLLEEDKYTLGQWCTDAALDSLGFRDRDQALKLPTCYALMAGINLTTANGLQFLEQWIELSRDGVSFPGPRNNDLRTASADPRCLGHGHDQTAAAAIAWHLGIPMYRGWLPFFSLPSWPRADEAIILAQGM